MFSSDHLLCGAARADITPEVGTLLYGYRPDQKSTSVHDKLSVTGLVLKQNDTEAVLLTVTVGDIQTELSEMLRKEAEASCGVSWKHVLISCTHTHSAPNVSGLDGWGDIDRKFTDNILLPAIRKVCREATASLRPAEVAVGVADSKIGINRRQVLRSGQIILGQNPWGCMDPNMTCIAVRDSETKKGIINMLHYGCHGTCAGCGEEISRDWSGVMTDSLEAATGTLTAFWNGAQGDVGPRLTNGTTTGNIRFVEELGGYAAMDAHKVYRCLGSFHPEKLSIVCGEIKLPYRKLPDIVSVMKRLSEYAAPETLINIDKLKYAHLLAVKEALEKGKNEDYFGFEQTIVGVGDLAFVPMPFEIFSDTSMRLRAFSPKRYTLVLSNTNGYNAYLPSQDQLSLGGYEVDCFNNCGAFILAENTDQISVEQNIQLIDKMR